MPQWFWANFTGGWHMVIDLKEIVPLKYYRAGFFVTALDDFLVLLFVGSSSLSFTGVQKLKYSWNLFGISTYYVTLGHRTYMKYFAITENNIKKKVNEVKKSQWKQIYKIYLKSNISTGSLVFCLSTSVL